MHLITFAHWPEARAFFDHLAPVRHSKYDWLYEFENGALIITGEGIHDAISKTTLTLGLYPQITSIYNFGVAGILGPHELHEIKEVRTCYAFDQKPLFKSFTLLGDTDLVTSGERILSEKDAAPLKTMASMVDRETWGVAFAAKEARIPLRSFKYLSDKAGELGACELVKDLAEAASAKLLQKYMNLDAEEKSAEAIKLPGFYFTFTQEKQLQTMLKKLSIKFDRPESSWLEDSALKALQEEKILPKERTKKFLTTLLKELDPFSYTLQEKIEETFSPLSHEKISITPLPPMETSDLKVQFVFNSKDQLLEKTQMLKNFNWDEYYKLWNGNL